MAETTPKKVKWFSWRRESADNKAKNEESGELPLLDPGRPSEVQQFLLAPRTSQEDYLPMNLDESFLRNSLTTQSSQSRAERRSSVPGAPRGRTILGNTPVLEFSAAVYYCLENEKTVKLDVIRLNSWHTRSHVGYKTIDETALAGSHYVHQEGVLTFEPGQLQGTIEITLIDDMNWGGLRALKVVLIDMGKEGNAILGYYLKTARVHRIDDDDVFPTLLYKDQILNNRLKQLGFVRLFKEYMRLCFSDPAFYRGFLKAVFIAFCGNLSLIADLSINAYMIDYILHNGNNFNAAKRKTHMMVLVLIKMIFLLLNHANAWWETELGIAGKIRMELTLALLDSFFNTSDGGQKQVENIDVVMALLIDVEYLIVCVKSLTKFIGAFGDIVMCTLFQICALYLSKGTCYVAMSQLALYPIIVGLIGYSRLATTQSAKELLVQKRHQCAQGFNETVNMHQLIHDFGKRFHSMDMHRERVQACAKAFKGQLQTQIQNTYVIKWLSEFFCCVFLLDCGWALIDGQMTIGIFLMCLRALIQVGKMWGTTYGIFMGIVDSAPALERIVKLINQPSMNRRKMEWSRRIQRVTKIFLEQPEVGDWESEDCCLLDRIPLRMDNITMNLSAYTGCVHANNLDKHRETSKSYGSLTIDQGSMCAIIGSHGSGKSTLLKLLGRSMWPQIEGNEESSLLVPWHLRVLHVPAAPIFFSGSLYANLTFGCEDLEYDGNVNRVMDICSDLQVGTAITQQICTQQSGNHTWEFALSCSEKHLLSIARALISNPDVICVHKPASDIETAKARNVLSILRNFVDERGYKIKKPLWCLRRLRTCIFTSTKMEHMGMADKILKVGHNGHIRSTDVDIEVPLGSCATDQFLMEANVTVRSDEGAESL